MITRIRMKNFKSWQDTGDVAIAPLTGFFGANVSLTQINDEFVDFPVDPDLSRFDRSDRKWVAAAKQLLVKNQEVAPIVNALDSDWAHFEAALNNQGVAIDFLCDKTHLKKG